MTDTVDNLSIISTERRVWLLLVDARETDRPSRVGDRIETLSYTLRLNSDAHRLIEISERADEAWRAGRPELTDDGAWRVEFERPLSKAEWYVAGPNGRRADVSTELVARLDAIKDDESAWEAELHRGDARLVRDLLAVDASPEVLAAALADDDGDGPTVITAADLRKAVADDERFCGVEGVQDDDYCAKPTGHDGPHQGNHAPFAADDGEPSEAELERIADNVGKPWIERVQP